MGGARETKATGQVGTEQGMKVGDIRVHEKGGEVHFHADGSGLKVAVPVGTWFTAWGKLESGASDKWEFVDIKRSTSLFVSIQRQISGTKVSIDTTLKIDKVVPEFGKTFEAMRAFTTAGKS